MRGKGDVGPKQPPLRLVDGGREALERELLWLIALGGDKARVEELTRILEPAANHALSVAQHSGHSTARCDPPEAEQLS